jgi:hypothetical protein
MYCPVIFCLKAERIRQNRHQRCNPSDLHHDRRPTLRHHPKTQHQSIQRKHTDPIQRICPGNLQIGMIDIQLNIK